MAAVTAVAVEGGGGPGAPAAVGLVGLGALASAGALGAAVGEEFPEGLEEVVGVGRVVLAGEFAVLPELLLALLHVPEGGLGSEDAFEDEHVVLVEGGVRGGAEGGGAGTGGGRGRLLVDLGESVAEFVVGEAELVPVLGSGGAREGGGRGAGSEVAD